MAFKLLVGGYGSSIAALAFKPASCGLAASLTYLTKSKAGSNPSWIALHPTNKTILYANNEGSPGSLLSFVVDPATGGLVQAARIASGGADPAHILPLSNGKEIYVTNYTSGNGQRVKLSADFKSFPSSGPINTFTGSGPNSSRQGSPHPHQAVEHGDEILVPDLGADKVWRLTKVSGSWKISGSVPQPAGSGPRHAVAVGQTLYTLHELSNTLTQHTLPTVSSGTEPKLLAAFPIIPEGANNKALGAGELLLSPTSSKYPTPYLYATNRNDPNPLGDTIAIFATQPQLTLVRQVRTGLKHIRGAILAGKCGEYLVAGGKDGGGIVVYSRTEGGTKLVELARNTSVTSPASFAWY